MSSAKRVLLKSIKKRDRPGREKTMTFLARLIQSCNRRRSEFFRKYLSRVGKLRISHATGSWGQNLFDDLDKLDSPRSFQTIFDVRANRGDLTQLFLRHFPNAVI